MNDERRGTNQNDPRREAVQRAGVRRSQATVALRQAVWIDVIEQVSALLAEDRSLTSVLGDAARCILDGFGLRAVAIGVVDGPWIEYRGVAAERHSIAHWVQHKSSQSEVAGTPFPTEITDHEDLGADEDSQQGLTPLIRLPIWSRQRIVAALIVEIDQASDLDVDDIEALSRIAQIIGHGLTRGARTVDPESGQTRVLRSSAEHDDLESLSHLTPERLMDWAASSGAVALRVVVDDWSGAWTMAGLPDPDMSVTRLLAVPLVREARETRQAQTASDLSELPAYSPVSPAASAITVVPILAGDVPVGAVIAEVEAGSTAEPAIPQTVAATMAGLLDQQRQRFNHLRAEQFVEVLDRVGHMSSLDDALVEALDALGSVLHGVLGFDAGFGVVREDRLHFPSIHRERPVPAWFHEGIPLELGITGRVALTGQEAFVPDVVHAAEYLDLGDGALSELCLPVYQDGDLIGVFNVESASRRLDDVDAQLVRTTFGMVHAEGRETVPEVPDDDIPCVPESVRGAPISRSGSIDPVTGVPDQSFFYDRLAATSAVVRETGVPASVLVVDVAVLDAGPDEFDPRDTVMREASQRLIGQLRGGDLVASFGDQRFAVLLAGVSAGVSLRIGNRLRRAIEERPVRSAGSAGVHLRCSVGIATTVIAEEAPEALVRNAVAALQHVKNELQQSVGHYREIEFATGEDRSPE